MEKRGHSFGPAHPLEGSRLSLISLKEVQLSIINVRAPGRVCLFGEHQDYLGLPVIPAAIDRYITIQAAPQTAQFLSVEMPDIQQFRQLSLDSVFRELAPRDYLSSGMKVLQERGIHPKGGYEVLLQGNIPISAGTSSSSALVVAWLVFLLAASDNQNLIVAEKLAQLAYSAEVLEHNEPGGMMDQYAIAYGGVILIESLQNQFKVTRLAQNLDGLVLGDSKSPKETIKGLTHNRSCVEKAVAEIRRFISDFHLVNAVPADLPSLLDHVNPELHPYLVATVENHAITRAAIEEFKSGNPDMRKLGNLMNRHHSQLRDHLNISTNKIEKMIAAALDAGALGAKINGSGGGGCIVALSPGRQKAVVAALQNLGVEAWPLSIAEGGSLF